MIIKDGMERSVKKDLEPMVAEAENQDRDMMVEISPKGRFTSKNLNPLVKAANALLPAFGQEPSYPNFNPGKFEQWPEDLVRIFSMFAAASRDAATADIIDPDLVIDFENATDDNDLQVLTGKVQSLAMHKDFKKWLKAPKEEAETEVEETETEESEMGDDKIDELFRNRI